MEQPMCLITSTDIGELEVMEEALEILRGLDQPVVVVAIVGLYRTGKSYLLNRLAGKSTGYGKDVAVYNTTRDCLRNYFPTRKCFVFVPPLPGEQMCQLSSLPDSALHPQFLRQANRFCEYIFQESQVKTIPGGQPVIGRLFGSLVQSYVRTIQSGQVPCPENMVTAMATIENEAAVKEALVHYTAGMGAQKLPVALGELSEVHRRCEAEALALFMQRSFKDEECLSQKRLMEAIKERYVKLLGENEAASKNSCHALLEELSAVMQKKLSDGVYCQPGGYEVYLRDQSQLVEDFRKAPNKGVKTEEVLEQFLASKRTEARTVLSVDKKMTEAEKSLAEEKQKAEMLEQQQKVMKEKQLQTEQLMKDQERSHQEHMRQLEAKVAEAAASAQQEAKRALECKLKEQEAMLQQGFKEKATMMEEEIAKLREEMSDKKMQELLRMAKVYGMVLRVIYDTFVRDVKNDNHHPS